MDLGRHRHRRPAHPILFRVFARRLEGMENDGNRNRLLRQRHRQLQCRCSRLCEGVLRRPHLQYVYYQCRSQLLLEKGKGRKQRKQRRPHFTPGDHSGRRRALSVRVQRFHPGCIRPRRGVPIPQRPSRERHGKLFAQPSYRRLVVLDMEYGERLRELRRNNERGGHANKTVGRLDVRTRHHLLQQSAWHYVGGRDGCLLLEEMRKQ